MKITIAKTSGFCMGVRRAVEMVLDSPGKHRKPIFTFGPLIHNPQVLDLLAEKGISIIREVPEKGEGTVIIRAHGVPPGIKKDLAKAGFSVVDGTCPRVIRVQTIISKHSRKGYATIIVGDRDHPEVIGLLGYAGHSGCVVGAYEELKTLPTFEKAIIVAQTTQNTEFFDSVRKWAEIHHPHYLVFNTICDSTSKRQAEVHTMAQNVDAVVVVGGKESGNTQRLAEIADSCGKPTYHVETEAELDKNALARARRIGITAGASTPNWVINRVFRTIEKIPHSARGGWRQWLLFEFQRSLLLTNIYVALGAGCLTYACTRLIGIHELSPHVLISVLYVFSMHLLNNLIGRKADWYNDPGRALFYTRHKTLLGILAVVAGGTGILVASTMGTTPLLVLLMMSLMGLSYSIRWIPKSLFSGRYRRIKDIPGAKTVLISLAWGVVTVLFPALATKHGIYLTDAVVFGWSVGIVFARTAFFDILDMQGDRIVGKETIPLLLGEGKTRQWLKSLLIGLTAVFWIASALEITPTLAVGLTFCPIFLLMILFAHEKGDLLPGIRLEFLIESHLIAAGIITFLWSLGMHLYF
jgi:(E)-4-hydroxy-3-methyl-but-2-enyl pyrophosphate reductase